MMQTLWCDASEPSLSDMFNDPMIQAVLRCDHLLEKDVMAEMSTMKSLLAAGRAEPSLADWGPWCPIRPVMTYPIA